MSEAKVKKTMSPQCKKELTNLLISILVMVVVSVLVVVLAMQTTKKEPDPTPIENDPVITELYGEYELTVDETFTAGEVIISKNKITGATKEGVSFIGVKNHTFDTGYNEVSGNIKIEFFLDNEGTILGYRFVEYGHSDGTWKPKVTEYLDAFINTKVANLEDTMATNKALYSGASESGEKTVDAILLALGIEVNK